VGGGGVEADAGWQAEMSKAASKSTANGWAIFANRGGRVLAIILQLHTVGCSCN
jgi:hypothetical protein